MSAHPYHISLEAAGHRLIREDDSSVDIFRLDAGSCNGPECELCGKTWCHHCQPDVQPCKRAKSCEKPPIMNDVAGEKPRPTIEELERILASNASLKIELQPDGSIRAVPSDAAKRAVAAVFHELRGRKGFSHWWDDIRKDDQADITKCAEEQVARVLPAAEQL